MNLNEIFERKGSPPKGFLNKPIKALFIKSANDDGSHNREASK